MKRRRRQLLAASVLLLGAAALILPDGHKSNNASVALVFIGFANQPLVIAQSRPQSEAIEANIIVTNTIFGRSFHISSALPREVNVPIALLVATNTGSVPVTLYAGIVRKVVSTNGSMLQLDENLAPPLTTGLPRMLKPGEAAIVEARISAKSQRWQTEFSYQRAGLREQLYARAWASGNSIIRGLLSSVFSGPDSIPVKSGLITNLPPIDVSVLPSTTFPFSAVSRRSIRISTNEFLFDNVLPNGVIRGATAPPNPRYDLIDFREEPPRLKN